MTIKEKLNEHKRNGLGFTILTILSLVILMMNMYPIITLNLSGLNYTLLILYTFLVIVIRIVLALVLERKGLSFAAHLVLFSFFLSNYFRQLFYLSPGLNALDTIFILIGVLISVYAIFKMYAHFDEVKTYFTRPNQVILIILAITLFRVYFDFGFDNMITHLLILIVVILSANAIESLLVAAAVYSVSLVGNVYTLFVSANAPAGTYITHILSVVINILLLAYIIRTYLNNNKIEYTN